MPRVPAFPRAEIDLASAAEKLCFDLLPVFRLVELTVSVLALQKIKRVHCRSPVWEFRAPVLVHALGTLSTASRAGELAVGGGACGVAELLRQLRPKLIVRARAVPR